MYKNYDNEGHCSCSNIDRYEARFAHIRLIGAGRNPDTVKVYISPRSAGRGNGVAAAQISPFCVSRACSLRCIRLRGGVAAGAKEADLVPIAFALCSLLVSCAVLSTAPAAESAAPDPPHHPARVPGPALRQFSHGPTCCRRRWSAVAGATAAVPSPPRHIPRAPRRLGAARARLLPPCPPPAPQACGGPGGCGTRVCCAAPPTPIRRRRAPRAGCV